MLRDNPNMYHSLHEEVALGTNEKEQEEMEASTEIEKLRRKLIEPYASGIVLETCVGNNVNRKYYQENKIRKIVGLDWVQQAIHKAN